jgi:internalin A
MPKDPLLDPQSARAKAGYNEARRLARELLREGHRILPLASLYLREVPPEVFAAPHLEYLDLSDNQLTAFDIPDQTLQNLVHLDLSNNYVAELDSQIGALRKLQFLDISNNYLNILPQELTTMPGLKTKDEFDAERLLLSGNELSEIPESLRDQGASNILTYIQSISEASEKLFEAKVILCGEGAVGKSTLVDKLTARLNFDNTKKRNRTHGVEVSQFHLPHADDGDRNITVNAWDFGGQHEYRVTHQLFFSNDALYLLLFHAREGAARGDIRGWLRLISRRVAHPKVILVATHAEGGRADLDFARLRAEFPNTLKGFIHIDSLSGLGIDALIESIAGELSSLPHVGKEFHPSWLRTKEALTTLTDKSLPSLHDCPFITFQRFTEIAEQHGVANEQCKPLLAMLHNMGCLVYWGNEPTLAETVILDAEWLAKAISYVVSDHAIKQSRGVVSEALLKSIWQRNDTPDRIYYEDDHIPLLMHLLDIYEVLYRITREESLVAQLVPDDRPRDIPWDEFGKKLPSRDGSGELVRAIAFIEIPQGAPDGLMAWLTVRNHYFHVDTKRWIWQSGVFLRDPIQLRGRREALVTLIDNGLRIEARGPNASGLLGHLIRSFRLLSDMRLRGLRYRVMLPCPTVTGIGDPCDGRYELGFLHSQLKNHGRGEAKVTCQSCYETASVVSILHENLIDGMGSLWDDFSDNAAIRALRQMSPVKAQSLLEGLLRELHGECPRIFSIVPSARYPRGDIQPYACTVWCEETLAPIWGTSFGINLDASADWVVTCGRYSRVLAPLFSLIVAMREGKGDSGEEVRLARAAAALWSDYAAPNQPAELGAILRIGKAAKAPFDIERGGYISPQVARLLLERSALGGLERIARDSDGSLAWVRAEVAARSNRLAAKEAT